MAKMTWRALPLLALVALAAGCGSQECSTTSDCAGKGADYVCANTRCVLQLAPDAGPACTPACSGATPVCDTNSLTCVACVGNSDCTDAANPACDTTTHTCVACAANSDCKDPSAPACDLTTHTCFACTDNSQCGGSTPVCDTATHACVACTGNSDCSGGTPVCDQATNTCVACESDSQCGGSTPACDTTSHTCVACTGDSNCGGSTPACDLGSHTCVACTGNSQCGANEVCDTSSHSCVGCLTDGDCSGGTPACNTTTHTCVACTGSNSSACSGSTPFCNTGTNSCVGCIDNTSCTDPSLPYCDATSSTCVACENDSQCTNPSLPVCDPSAHACVAAINCTDNTPCTGTSTPVCDTGRGYCVQCTSSDATACGGGTPVCNTTTDKCGQCDSTNSTACTGSTPVCDVGSFTCVQCNDNSTCTALEDCNVGTHACAPADTTTPSTEIGNIRGTAPGTGLSLPVDGTIVTYLKPGIGSGIDAKAGFFVQAQQTGPAIFVSVDPSTLSPAPAVGDRVTFTVTDLATDGGVVEAQAISNFGIWDGGAHPVDALVQDLSGATDVVTNLDGYESELVKMTGTLGSSFGSAGTGFESAELVTAGVTSTKLKGRLPSGIITDLNLSDGCVLTFSGGPMWRFGTQAQPSEFSDSEVLVQSCPAPTLVSAKATTDNTHVTLTFDRELAAASVTAGAFTIDNGVTVSAAVYDGAYSVELTTSAQTANTTYTVTVNGVTDTAGTAISATGNTGTFTGFTLPAHLVISEINAGITSANGGDTVELYVTSGGDLNGIAIQELVKGSQYITFNPMAVNTGDVILLHVGSTAATCSEAGATKTTCAAGTTPYANYSDSAYDIVGSTTGIANSASRVLAVIAPDGSYQDAVVFTNSITTASTDSNFVTVVNGLQSTHVWMDSASNALCTDNLNCQQNDALKWPSLSSTGSNSISRSTSATPGTVTQWGGTSPTAATSTWGTVPGGF